MKIIAVANQKGGAAKTTTSSVLAAGLQKRGYKVLAIDLDPQGNLSSSAGADKEGDTIKDVLKLDVPLADVIQRCSEYDLIPANSSLTSVINDLTTGAGGQLRLRKAIQDAPIDYDYIVLDTPPELGQLTISALAAANEVLIPSAAERFSTEGILLLFNTIQNVRDYFDADLKVAGILLTQFKSNSNLSKSGKVGMQELADHFGVKMFSSTVRSSVKIGESQWKDQSILSYSPSSKVAKDYLSFIDEYLQEEA